MEQSSGSLRFKISLTKQEMEHEVPESKFYILIIIS